MDHREQNSSCPVTWEEEPRGFLTEWEATPLEPTEDQMTQNDRQAARKLVRFADGIIPPGTVIGSFVADEHDDKAIIAEVITPAPEAAALIRAQAARIAELEALVAADFDMLDSTWKARAEAAEAEVARLTAELEAARAGLNTAWADRDMHCRRAEKAEAALSEMTRRRDEWRKKAEGFDAVRLALREKVGTPWPPNMSRILWAGIAADEKKRADDAEAEVARLREALGDALDAWDTHNETGDMMQGYWVSDARAALAKKEAGAVFPPPHCTAWEDCNHDGICHDPKCCGATGPNHEAFYGEAGE